MTARPVFISARSMPTTRPDRRQRVSVLLPLKAFTSQRVVWLRLELVLPSVPCCVVEGKTNMEASGQFENQARPVGTFNLKIGSMHLLEPFVAIWGTNV
jgi:hypothetical protein